MLLIQIACDSSKEFWENAFKIMRQIDDACMKDKHPERNVDHRNKEGGGYVLRINSMVSEQEFQWTDVHVIRESQTALNDLAETDVTEEDMATLKRFDEGVL